MFNWKFCNSLIERVVMHYGSGRFMLHKGDLLQFDNDMGSCRVTNTNIDSATKLAECFASPNTLRAYDNKPVLINSIVNFGSKIRINGQPTLVCEGNFPMGFKVGLLNLSNNKIQCVPHDIEFPITTDDFAEILTKENQVETNIQLVSE